MPGKIKYVEFPRMSLTFLFIVGFIIACWQDRIYWLLKLFSFSKFYLFILFFVTEIYLDISKFKSPRKIYMENSSCITVSFMQILPTSIQCCQVLCVFPHFMHSKHQICFLFSRYCLSTHICRHILRLMSTVENKKYRL